MTEQEYMVHFQLIATAGESKTKSMLALEEAENGNFDKAEELLKEAVELQVEAHNIQLQMLQKEGEGKPVEPNIIVIHAQDHLTMATLMIEITERTIQLYRRLLALENK